MNAIANVPACGTAHQSRTLEHMPDSPFDDPEFLAQMERMGVKHKPGMADELMKELAPLMRADGVDLDDPGSVDLDTLNAAMASATERRNMELVTPIGTHRDMALATLRVVSEAIADGDDVLAHGILGSIDPDPTPDAPSVSHVIGVAVEMVAAWHADPAFASSIARTKVPAWGRKASRKAASDVLALAPKGRATAAIDSLIRRHGGLSVFEGGALAVAGMLIARAGADGTTVAALGADLLGSAPAPSGGSADGSAPRGSASPGRSGHAPGRPAAPTGSSFHRFTEPSQEHALDAFGKWLDAQPDTDDELMDDEIDALDAIIVYAEEASLDLRFAAHIPPLLEVIDERIAEDPVLLDALDDYVHFRLASGLDPAGWEAAHDAIKERMEDEAGVATAISNAMARRDAVPPAERGAVLNELRLVQATEELLAWIGDGRPVTGSGLPRRADIGVVAGMFGVAAHGSAKRVPGDPTAVRSLLDLPTVAAWWDALAVLGVIDIRATRVRLGPTSGEWLPDPSLEAREVLVMTYVGGALRMHHDADSFERSAYGYATARLAAAFDSMPGDVPLDELPIVARVGRRLLERLAGAGIVEFDAADGLRIPVSLHAPIAYGMMLAADLGRGDA